MKVITRVGKNTEITSAAVPLSSMSFVMKIASSQIPDSLAAGIGKLGSMHLSKEETAASTKQVGRCHYKAEISPILPTQHLKMSHLFKLKTFKTGQNHSRLGQISVLVTLRGIHKRSRIFSMAAGKESQICLNLWTRSKATSNPISHSEEVQMPPLRTQ